MDREPFTSVHELLQWSYEGFRVLEKLVTEYVASGPYEMVAELDTATGEYVHKARLTEPFPNTIPLYVFDIVNAQRAALDHAIFASGLMLLGRNPERTKFPFEKDDATALKDIKKNKREIDPDIVQVALSCLRSDDAYRTLRKLNQVRNMKHHRVVAPTSLAIYHLHVSDAVFGATDDGWGMHLQPATWDGAKGELSIFRSGVIEQHREINIIVNIHFGDDTDFSGQSVLDALIRSGKKALEVIEHIEAETKAILAKRAS